MYVRFAVVVCAFGIRPLVLSDYVVPFCSQLVKFSKLVDLDGYLAKASAAASDVETAPDKNAMMAGMAVTPMPGHSLGGEMPDSQANHASVINGEVTYSGVTVPPLPVYTMPH
jgi:hypothetical protein